MPEKCPCCGTLLKHGNHFKILQKRSSVILKGDEYKLPKTLFELLSLLYQRMPNYVSHDGIMTVLYADRLDPPFDSAVKVHVMKLRKILAETDLKIVTVWGVGYRLELSVPVTVHKKHPLN